MDKKVVEICLVFSQGIKKTPTPTKPVLMTDDIGFFVIRDRFALPDTIKEANLTTLIETKASTRLSSWIAIYICWSSGRILFKSESKFFFFLSSFKNVACNSENWNNPFHNLFGKWKKLVMKWDYHNSTESLITHSRVNSKLTEIFWTSLGS